jgi:Transposase Tn5 dimerisation domain/Transposase DDE domain
MTTVRATAATLRPPSRSDRKLPPVTVNVVLVREESPAQDEEPIEWFLITTLPIATVEDVRDVIAYYTVRWMIEVLFRTLKSGCRVEERRFEHIDRLLPCAAIYLIVAWRTLLVCQMGRNCPDISCEAIFEPAEWKSAYVTVTKKRLPSTPPPLQQMVSLIAQLGGYVNRPGRKDPPGAQTIWLGMQRMQDLALAWASFGPDIGAKVV